MSEKVIKVLVVESTVFGYDGITNVITNYYLYQDHNRVHMDLVTINNVSERFKKELELHGSVNFVLPYRNRNPIGYIYSLFKIIKKGKYQIVHVHGCSATMAVEMLAAKLAGIEVRISHSHNTKCDHAIVDKMLRPFFSRWCNVCFACGKEAGEWMFPGKHFNVINNGIDLEKFQYDEVVRREMRKNNGLADKFVIGHVGRFSNQKNHRKLLDIFSELSKIYDKVKLVLIGDGELRKEIEDRAEREKLNVLFVGLSDEVEKWLQAMDIMVFPSLFEGLPLGLIEAQAAGLPCVLSNTISIDTKITDLVEFVELNASLKEWADAVCRNRYGFDRLAQKEFIKNQIRNAHFDIRANCKELADIYEGLVTNMN